MNIMYKLLFILLLFFFINLPHTATCVVSTKIYLLLNVIDNYYFFPLILSNLQYKFYLFIFLIAQGNLHFPACCTFLLKVVWGMSCLLCLEYLKSY